MLNHTSFSCHHRCFNSSYLATPNTEVLQTQASGMSEKMAAAAQNVHEMNQELVQEILQSVASHSGNDSD